MKMLTGDISPSSGSAFLGGFDLSKYPRQARKLIGYCPQFDALLPLLTVREHLELFAGIKGLSGLGKKMAVKELMERLTLSSFSNKLAGSLSGGNKRKLSVAVAMIGSPRIMFLDEASTGMDVVSKRFMWSVIESMTSGKFNNVKTAVVLTTHSMDECEALCSRIAIMVSGKIQMLGSIQHLKSRFGKGIMIGVKLLIPTRQDALKRMKNRPDLPDTVALDSIGHCATLLGNIKKGEDILNDPTTYIYQQLNQEISMATLVEWWILDEYREQVIFFMKQKFDGPVTVLEQHEAQLTFGISNSKLAQTFEILESSKISLHIQNYSVSQTSLEQIFNSLAKNSNNEI